MARELYKGNHFNIAHTLNLLGDSYSTNKQHEHAL